MQIWKKVSVLPLTWGQGEGFNLWSKKIAPHPVTTHHHHHSSPKLLLCYNFQENNSMRDLCVLNLACNYCNLHLFDAQRHIISHQHSGLFVHVWHTYGKHMWHRCMAMCVVHLCVCSCMCVRHDPDTCKNEMSREKWYSTCLLPSCHCMLLLCSRM